MSLTDISLLAAGSFFLIVFSGLFLSFMISRRRRSGISRNVPKNILQTEPPAPLLVSYPGANIKVHKINNSLGMVSPAEYPYSPGNASVKEIKTVSGPPPLRLQVLNSPVPVNNFARDYYRRAHN